MLGAAGVALEEKVPMDLEEKEADPPICRFNIALGGHLASMLKSERSKVRGPLASSSSAWTPLPLLP